MHPSHRNYATLNAYLLTHAGSDVTLTLLEIAAMVGGLPLSAIQFDEWWSNATGRASRHAHARAWLDAGYHVRVDRLAGQATFVARPATSSAQR